MSLKRSIVVPGAIAVLIAAVAWQGCYYTSDTPDLEGRDIRLTLIHTSDIHSRILPYDYTPTYTEEKLGLVDGRGPYGGLARIAYLVKRERSKAGRSLWLDSGDLFQGAPIFNAFKGEPEVRALTLAGVDAFALGNHEFDVGTVNVEEQFASYAGFPILAANYDFIRNADDSAIDFSNIVDQALIFNLGGLKVGVIGMGNTSSMTSIHEADNSLGIRPYDAVQTAQGWVWMIRDSVDVVILLSHLGLTTDEVVGQNVCGIDIILGGHHHVALNPPKIIPYDPDPEIVFGEQEEGDYDWDVNTDDNPFEIGVCPDEYRRDTILAHPSAFAKFVARLDLVVRDGRIRSHSLELFPVDNTVPEDADVSFLLEDYVTELNRIYDLDRVVAKATVDISRFGETGGDSMLGNFVCEAMQKRKYVETDFCVTNSLGLRTDILAGDVTMETMFNVLPFENTITTMTLSGVEVQTLLDYATERSAWRGCSTQVQVSGVSFTMNCRTGRADDIMINGEPLQEDMFYELATNNYMAWGGSGFEMLKINTTKVDTGISMRDAVIDYMYEHPELPECFDNEDVEACTEGIAIEDGRILPSY